MTDGPRARIRGPTAESWPMRPSRSSPLLGIALVLGAFAALAACSSTKDDAEPTPLDAGTSADAESTYDGATGLDGAVQAAPAVCTEGRRRCVGMDLQICDNGGWTLLQSCLAGEWCDVAVGICRMVDAGPDADAP